VRLCFASYGLRLQPEHQAVLSLGGHGTLILEPFQVGQNLGSSQKAVQCAQLAKDGLA